MSILIFNCAHKVLFIFSFFHMESMRWSQEDIMSSNLDQFISIGSWFAAAQNFCEEFTWMQHLWRRTEINFLDLTFGFLELD
jgi:hypothetical protein